MFLTEDEFKILCGLKMGLNSKKNKRKIWDTNIHKRPKNRFSLQKVRSKRQMGIDRCCKYEKS